MALAKGFPIRGEDADPNDERLKRQMPYSASRGGHYPANGQQQGRQGAQRGK